jgi:transposase
MIRSGTIMKIKESAQAGKSAYAIGRELSISKNTARKYMQPGVPAPVKHDRPSKLDTYKPFLHELMASGIYNCVVLLERLQEAGYNGGISILKEYVHPFRPPKKLPAVRRYETAPGKQAQMDWGICHYTDTGGTIHKVPVFVMVLGHSRAKYIEFASRCDLASLERCMANAFVHFGGVPEKVLTDNMKTVIIGRDNGKPIWNTAFEDFSVDMGFVPKVCAPRRPQTKGKVERLVGHVKDNFLPGRSFEDLNDLNRQALQWCHKGDMRVHGTTGRIPAEELSKEALLSLPPQEVMDKYRWEARIVTRDGFVSFDGIRYGVPWQYSGRQVQVRLCAGHVEIHLDNTLIAKHEAKYSGGRIVWLPGQYSGLSEKGGMPLPNSFARQATPQVEVRDLSEYDFIFEVASNG